MSVFPVYPFPDFRQDSNPNARIRCGRSFHHTVHPPSNDDGGRSCAPEGMHTGFWICVHAFLRSLGRCRGPPAPYQFSKNFDKEQEK